MASNRKTAGGVSVPVGYRFRPTEEELVNDYLKKKKQDKSFKVNHIIPEIDHICNYEPWDIPALLFTEPDSPYYDMEWFFFCPRDYMSINSTRSNRTTPEGHWKITGKERLIRARGSNAVIGRKRTLTFYGGRAPNHKKTNWVMHEYYLIESETIPDPELAQRDSVLCRLKKKPDKNDSSICAEGEPSSCNVPNCEDQPAAVVTPEDYSSSALQSPGDVHQANGTNDDCNDMQSPFGENNYHVMDRNDISTCDGGEPYVSGFKNDAADHMFPEVYPQPEENWESLFRPLERQDYTLPPLVNSEVGDAVLHDNNYTGYNEFHSPIWGW